MDEEQYLKLEEERAAAEEAERLGLALQQAARLAVSGRGGGFTAQETQRLVAEANRLAMEADSAVQEVEGSAALGAEISDDAPGETDASAFVMEGGADVAASGANGPQRTAMDEDFLPHGPETDADREEKPAMSSGAAALYQDSTERANENRSSAWILMAMGSIGLVVIVLGIMGVIPLHFSNPYLFYGVMAAVFLLFLVAGMVSLKNARIFEKKAESENSLRDAMLTWCRESLHAQELDGEIGVDGTESEEALYFKRFECIKAKLNYQFVNLDQGFLEKFIDDSVYDMIFQENEESA